MVDAIWYGLQLLGLLVLFVVGWALVQLITRARDGAQRERPDRDRESGGS